MNTYLKELEKLNQELSEMSPEDLENLIKDVDISNCEDFAVLEKYILGDKDEVR